MKEVAWPPRVRVSPENLAKARQAAERSLELARDTRDGHVAMSFYYRARGVIDRALDELKAAARFSPFDARVAGQTARAWLQQGRFEEAVLEFEKALRLNPRNAGDTITMADALRQLLSIPSRLSVAELRLTPEVDPLRGHPRFEQLIADEPPGDPIPEP